MAELHVDRHEPAGGTRHDLDRGRANQVADDVELGRDVALGGRADLDRHRRPKGRAAKSSATTAGTATRTAPSAPSTGSSRRAGLGPAAVAVSGVSRAGAGGRAARGPRPPRSIRSLPLSAYTVRSPELSATPPGGRVQRPASFRPVHRCRPVRRCCPECRCRYCPERRSAWCRRPGRCRPEPLAHART